MKINDKTEIDFTSKPGNFYGCKEDSSTCPLASKCLRAQYLSYELGKEQQYEMVTIVNFRNRGISYATAECKKFVSDKKVRFAVGMRHIYDKVPHGIHSDVRLSVMSCFSNTRYFYEAQNGSRLISPKTQKAIADVFKLYGMDFAPEYDHYVEQYDWQE